MRRYGIMALSLFLTGCPGFGDKTIDDLNTVGMVTYHGQIKAILDARCATCHAATPIAGATNSLHDYESAAAEAERIHARAVIEMTMPPGAALNAEDRALIDAWYKSGAPEGSPADDAGAALDAGDMDGGPSDDGGEPDGGGASPTWDDDISPIMAASCAFPGCHADESASASLDLSTYAGYQAGGTNGDLSGGGDPDESLFMDHLLGRSGKLLMPIGGAQLPDEQIGLISTWLLAGSPEN